MKTIVNIPRVSFGAGQCMSDPVSLPAPPWGYIDQCDRADTAPRHRRLAAAKPTQAEMAIAAIREMRTEQ